MSAEETEKLISKATFCVDEECSVDDVEDLIEVLKGQQKELFDRVGNIKNIIRSLEVINDSDSREVDEVKETIRALYRVFQLGAKASGKLMLCLISHAK